MTHQHDWIEKLRRVLYPRLHPYLDHIGLYSVGAVGGPQHVATIQMGEEEFEKYMLHEHHFKRNPLATYKTAPDGRKSTLSLRLTHEGSRQYQGNYAGPEKQLHWTIFNAADGAIDLYAHYEYDWVAAPLKHLRGKEVSAAEGGRRSMNFLIDATDLEAGDDYITND